MTVPRWLLTDIQNTLTATGYKHVVKTNTPCHLWLRWTTTPPRTHSKSILIRGLRLKDDLRFCFVTYHDNEQEEAGDTLQHTFIKEPWPSCETRYFYFHGTVSGQFSPSTTAIFNLHRLAPPAPYIIYPDAGTGNITVDGVAHRLDSYSDWAGLRGGDGNYSTDTVDSLQVKIYCCSSSPLWCTLSRALLTLDLSEIPPEKSVLSARLSLYGLSKLNEFPEPMAINVYQSNPDFNNKIVNADYQHVLNTPLSAAMLFDSWNITGRNVFELNPAGLALLIPGHIVKLGLREVLHDVANSPPTWGSRRDFVMACWSADKGDPYRPYLEVNCE